VAIGLRRMKRVRSLDFAVNPRAWARGSRLGVGREVIPVRSIWLTWLMTTVTGHDRAPVRIGQPYNAHGENCKTRSLVICTAHQI